MNSRAKAASEASLALRWRDTRQTAFFCPFDEWLTKLLRPRMSGPTIGRGAEIRGLDPLLGKIPALGYASAGNARL